MMISYFLLEGKEKDILGNELADPTGQINGCQLVKIVELKRKFGAPICVSADINGAGNNQSIDALDLNAYRHNFVRTLNNVGQTRRQLEAAFLRMSGQIQLGGG